MKRKAVLGIMLTLLFIGILSLTFDIQPVEAPYPIIYIRADGSIDPATANITSSDNVTYTFTDDINASIVVEKNNTVVDGAGYTLQGNRTGTGIDLHNRNNVTLKNIEVTNFSYGIYLNSSSYNTITSNIASSNKVDGIRLYYSGNNTVTANIASSNFDGIYLNSSSNNTLAGNTVSSNNFDGIYLGHSSNNNTVIGNTASNNEYGIRLYNSSNNVLFHNNLISNAVQARVSTGYVNIWDDGYPSGGNYWSDHNPPDIYSGSYQNETGRDKIGDIPYVIDENNTDRYPLIYPYGRVSSADINDDGTVDIYDAIILAGKFGSEPGHLGWHPAADLNQDGIIDIFDAIIFAWWFWRPIIL